MISCHLYDLIEIACMHQYPVKFTMKDNLVIKCTALDTQYNDKREECIKVRLINQLNDIAEGINDPLYDGIVFVKGAEKMKETLIPLAKIATVETLVQNPHFKFISFI